MFKKKIAKTWKISLQKVQCYKSEQKKKNLCKELNKFYEIPVTSNFSKYYEVVNIITNCPKFKRNVIKICEVFYVGIELYNFHEAVNVITPNKRMCVTSSYVINKNSNKNARNSDTSLTVVSSLNEFSLTVAVDI